MDHLTLAHLITSIGLVADIFGAGFLALGLIIKEDDALKLSATTGLAYTMDKPAPRDEQLKQPAVRDRLTQSRRAKWGFSLLFFGFAFQLLGTWLG